MAAGPDRMGIGTQTQVASIESCETGVSDGEDSEIIFRQHSSLKRTKRCLLSFFACDASHRMPTQMDPEFGVSCDAIKNISCDLVALANKMQVLRKRDFSFSERMEMRRQPGVSSFASRRKIPPSI